MAYAVVSDLVARYGERELIQLTDRLSPPSEAIDPAVATKALSDASDVIDGYISAWYALPLTEAPPMLAELACVIARYKLYIDAPTAKVKEDYDDAMKRLSDISKGVMKIPGLAGVEPEARQGVVLAVEQDRLFTRDSMQGF